MPPAEAPATSSGAASGGSSRPPDRRVVLDDIDWNVISRVSMHALASWCCGGCACPACCSHAAARGSHKTQSTLLAATCTAALSSGRTCEEVVAVRLTVWTLQTISSAAHLPLQAVRTRSNLQCLEKRYEHSPACKSSPPRPLLLAGGAHALQPAVPGEVVRPAQPLHGGTRGVGSGGRPPPAARAVPQVKGQPAWGGCCQAPSLWLFGRLRSSGWLPSAQRACPTLASNGQHPTRACS